MAFLITLIDIYSFLLFIFFLSSWFPNSRENSFISFLANFFEPYLSIFSFIPSIGYFNLSSLIAFLSLSLARNGIVYLLG